MGEYTFKARWIRWKQISFFVRFLFKVLLLKWVAQLKVNEYVTHTHTHTHTHIYIYIYIYIYICACVRACVRGSFKKP